MELFPAIDLRAGRCVRLRQGDYAAETVYDDDPVRVARQFGAEGVRWVHVVDLDGARTGEPLNREVVAAIAGALAGTGVSVQCGGGVRSAEAAEALLATGVARVVLGTVAVEDPALVRRLARAHPGRIAAGLDTRDGEVAVRGWTQGSGRRVGDVLDELAGAGVAAVILTDIGRDGMLAGPDVVGLAHALERVGPDSPEVIASGGVTTIADLRTLASLRSARGRGLDGVIVGKALYEGRLTVAEGVQACAASV